MNEWVTPMFPVGKGVWQGAELVSGHISRFIDRLKTTYRIHLRTLCRKSLQPLEKQWAKVRPITAWLNRL